MTEGVEADAKDTDEWTVNELIAQIAAEDEVLAAQVEQLNDQLSETKSQLDSRADEIDELESRLKRVHADFQNYKKRADRREEQLRERATEDLIERLLDVRDNLVRALEQDDDIGIRDGVEATLATFDRVLEAENVTAIEPQPGDEVDPTRHEVMMRVESDRASGLIDDVYRTGYELAGKVLRPAQITVSDDDTTEE